MDDLEEENDKGVESDVQADNFTRSGNFNWQCIVFCATITMVRIYTFRGEHCAICFIFDW